MSGSRFESEGSPQFSSAAPINLAFWGDREVDSNASISQIGVIATIGQVVWPRASGAGNENLPRSRKQHPESAESTSFYGLSLQLLRLVHSASSDTSRSNAASLVSI